MKKLIALMFVAVSLLAENKFLSQIDKDLVASISTPMVYFFIAILLGVPLIVTYFAYSSMAEKAKQKGDSVTTSILIATVVFAFVFTIVIAGINFISETITPSADTIMNAVKAKIGSFFT